MYPFDFILSHARGNSRREGLWRHCSNIGWKASKITSCNMFEVIFLVFVSSCSRQCSRGLMDASTQTCSGRPHSRGVAITSWTSCWTVSCHILSQWNFKAKWFLHCCFAVSDLIRNHTEICSIFFDLRLAAFIGCVANFPWFLSLGPYFSIMLSGLHNWHNARKDPSDKTQGNKNAQKWRTRKGRIGNDHNHDHQKQPLIPVSLWFFCWRVESRTSWHTHTHQKKNSPIMFPYFPFARFTVQRWNNVF